MSKRKKSKCSDFILGAFRWMKMKDFFLKFRLCVQVHLMDFYFYFPFVATSALIFLYWHSVNCMNSIGISIDIIHCDVSHDINLNQSHCG